MIGQRGTDPFSLVQSTPIILFAWEEYYWLDSWCRSGQAL
jgi:hypothetical protein